LIGYDSLAIFPIWAIVALIVIGRGKGCVRTNGPQAADRGGCDA
jgi:hypothetical protein